MVNHNDDAVHRLRDADPARDVPDLDVVRMKLRLRAQGDAAQGAPERTRWLVAVGVAASILMVAGSGAAGIALGRSSASSTAEEGTTTALEQVAAPVNAGGPVSRGQDLAAGGGVAAPSMSKEMAMYPFTAGGLVASPELEDTPGRAAGYRISGQGVDREALAKQLASTLGLAGSPVRQDYGWVVGSTDGIGPSLWVSDDATVSWSFSNPQASPWTCAADPSSTSTSATPGSQDPASADVSVGSTGASSPGFNPGPPDSCEPAAPPMRVQEAQSRAEAIVKSLGVTADAGPAVGIEWESGSDAYTTWVTGWHLVEGQRTQLSWSFTFSDRELAWASGVSASVVKLADFPVLGARSAVERSSDPRFAAFGPMPSYDGGVIPMAEARAGNDVAPAVGSAASGSTQGTPATDTRAEGTRVRVWWDPAVATSATPALSQYWEPEGTLLMLPAYRLETADDRGVWTVISVDSTFVDFVSSQD